MAILILGGRRGQLWRGGLARARFRSARARVHCDGRRGEHGHGGGPNLPAQGQHDLRPLDRAASVNDRGGGGLQPEPLAPRLLGPLGRLVLAAAGLHGPPLVHLLGLLGRFALAAAEPVRVHAHRVGHVDDDGLPLRLRQPLPDLLGLLGRAAPPGTVRASADAIDRVDGDGDDGPLLLLPRPPHPLLALLGLVGRIDGLLLPLLRAPHLLPLVYV
eukprot:8404299-Pyramimonas_sp.AAC.1